MQIQPSTMSLSEEGSHDTKEIQRDRYVLVDSWKSNWNQFFQNLYRNGGMRPARAGVAC